MSQEHHPGDHGDHHPPILDRRESIVDKEAWHLSKSVPVAFVIALMIQTAALVSWAVTFRAEFVAHRDVTASQFEDIRDYIDAKTRDRITGNEVRAEFRARDIQLIAIEKRDEALLGEVRRVQQSIENRLGRIENKIDQNARLVREHSITKNNNGNGH